MKRPKYLGDGLPELLDLELARPNTVFDYEPVSELVRERLGQAGVGLVGIPKPGQEEDALLPYKLADTPQTWILGVIYKAEYEGRTVPDCITREVNALIDGTFDDAWGHFYARQQG